MILSDQVTELDMPYFHELAKRVCDGLNACGFIHCPGDAMAMNEKWCQPYSVWQQYFADWIEKPEPMALMLSSIIFDLRPVHGDLSLHKKLQNNILEHTVNNSLFIAHMVSNALSHKPPIGFFRTFVLIHDGEHDNTLDIKHRGIVPITDLVRMRALEGGVQYANTFRRLEAVAELGIMNESDASSLRDALVLINRIRLQHQAEQMSAGQKPSNFVPPDELSPLMRRNLKAAFMLVVEAQNALAHRYQVH